MKRAAVQLGLSFACWTLLGATYAVNRAVYHLTIGAPPELFAELSAAVLDYWIWAALTPVIFAFVKRAPFTAGAWPRAAALHTVACGAFSLAHACVAEVIRLPNEVPAGFRGVPFELRILQSFNNDLWMYGTVVIVASLVGYYRRYRERDVAVARLGEELARAELQALRNQLNPHLLFNALNSVAALMHEDVQAADDMLVDLSHLLRVYLSGDARQETTLREELDLVGAYVGIQRRRFGDRLAFATEVEDAALDAVVPSLLLQPLVENAILHGIAPATRAGKVVVRVGVEGGALRLVVADDGIGMRAGVKEGIGLSNTRARLGQLYGDAQSLDVRAAPGEGVTVTITLPLRAAVEETRGNEDPNADRGRRAPRAEEGGVAAQG